VRDSGVAAGHRNRGPPTQRKRICAVALPGDQIRIPATLKAPTYDCASIAYFKMIAADGKL
jgi:hypothetical protein